MYWFMEISLEYTFLSFLDVANIVSLTLAKDKLLTDVTE